MSYYNKVVAGQRQPDKTLTFEELEQGLLYVASGSDLLQAPLRFGALVKTFVSVNVGSLAQPTEVIDSMSHALDLLHGLYGPVLELVEEPRYTHLQNMDHETPDGRWRSLLDSATIRDYQEVFSRYQNEDDWAVEFSLVRNVGCTKRPIKLVHLNGEALACYLALTRNGQSAPKYLCAIQSGRLEKNDSPLISLMKGHASKPTFFLRGFWPGAYKDKSQGKQLVFYGAGSNPYRRSYQQFRGWSSIQHPQLRGSECYASSTPSLVKLCTRQKSPRYAMGTPQMMTKTSPGVYVRQHSFRPDPRRWDAVAIPESLTSKLPALQPSGIETALIKPPMLGRHTMHLPAGLEANLVALQRLCQGRAKGCVALVPDVFEDDLPILTSKVAEVRGACEVDVLLPEEGDYHRACSLDQTI